MENALEALLGLSRGALAVLYGAVGQLADGIISVDQFQEIVLALLLQAHTQAVVIGRHAAGDTSPLADIDRELAKSVMGDEREYIEGLVEDINTGQFDEVLDNGDPRAGTSQRGSDIDQDSLKSRVGLYVGRLAGTANEAWANALDGHSLIWWELGVNEDHCEACPELAAGSPYTQDALPTYPGANQTPCLFWCKCSLRLEDGSMAFNPRDLVAEALAAV